MIIYADKLKKKGETFYVKISKADVEKEDWTEGDLLKISVEK